jgi:predicted nucleic-acid-binding Zn-ribbon protein
MKQTGRCPKCAGVDIVQGTGAEDEWSEEQEFLASFRSAAKKTKEKDAGLTAWVCCGCGFVEWYALQPRRLKRHPQTKSR